MGNTEAAGRTYENSQLTVKGQVTLPKELRDRFNLEPGSRVAFEEEADGI